VTNVYLEGYVGSYFADDKGQRVVVPRGTMLKMYCGFLCNEKNGRNRYMPPGSVWIVDGEPLIIGGHVYMLRLYAPDGSSAEFDIAGAMGVVIDLPK